MLLIAESSHEVSAFAAQAAAVPGSAEEREGLLAGISHTEVYPLTLFAVGGMLLFPAANDLLTMFVALEVLSLPLYLLCGLARRRRLLSQEAAMKYFLLGAFSSAFFLFGVAHAVRLLRTRCRLSAIATAAGGNTPSSVLLYAGIALLGVGPAVQDRRRAVPGLEARRLPGRAHPGHRADGLVHPGAAFGALLRVFYVAFGQLTWDWRPVMWGVAILTMLVGSIIAITQTDVKRLLAYSSIAQAGYILTGVVAANTAGLSSSMFYLAAYGLATIGAFAVVTLVRDQSGEAASPVPLGRARQAFPAGRRRVRLLPDRVRRDPADQRVHRKVRRVPGRDRRRCAAAGHRRRAQQRDPGVPLRPRDRADVLQRARARRPAVVTAERVHLGRGRHRACWPRWCSASRPSRCSVWPTMPPPAVRPLTPPLPRGRATRAEPHDTRGVLILGMAGQLAR